MEWVVAHFHPLVQAQIRMRLGPRASKNHHDVEDLAADVWLVALQRVRELKPRHERYTPVLVKFLATTAINRCNNFLRELVRRPKAGRHDASSRGSSRPEPMDRFTADTLEVVSSISQNEIQALISKCLRELPPDKEEVLLLRLVEQRSNGEISEILGLQPNAVAVRYRRALQELRRRLPRSVFQGIWSAVPADRRPTQGDC